MLDSQFVRQLQDEVIELRRRIALIEARERSTEYITLTDGVTAPTAVSGLALIYVDTSDGDLKVRFGDNVTTVIAADT